MKTEVIDYAIVKSTIGFLKQQPSFEAEAADEVLFGMVVKLIEKHLDGWYLIETSYGYKGYIHEEQLYICGDKALKWDNEANHIVSWGIVDVMKEPKFESYPINVITRGGVVKLSGEVDENWAEIILPDESKGWVRKDFIIKRIKENKESEEILRENVVKTALSYLGTQYRWGGKSPLGIDCSGLCSISYLINGIIIYRDAQLKEEYNMRRITREEMKPGDLLYYPGHVAMYIGNDKYIHSTGKSSGVVINSLNPKDLDYREDLTNIKEIGTIF